MSIEPELKLLPMVSEADLKAVFPQNKDSSACTNSGLDTYMYILDKYISLWFTLGLEKHTFVND